MKILHQNCDPELAKDKTLPYNAYLVTYEVDGAIAHDLVLSNRKTEMFDHYWDKYREGFKGWKQSDGMVNPKLWGIKPKETKKR